MRFTTKAEYGFVCLIYMAKQTSKNWVTVKEIAEKEHFSATYIEKIMQALRGANIVTSHHGKEGGYSLARPPSAINLRQVIEALEGHTFEVFCEPELRENIVCTHFCMCGISSIWEKTKKILDDFFTSMTLETLVKEKEEKESLHMKGLMVNENE
ncbi:MAG: Rrf2 family transcriptional regulator [Chlamydiae bacterium]|nr:Rrf2 family transcriptional regulator [Chlamydiota bacterium]MBI3276264.1 Rrf2 family transcriptional regulator [Chlamydiota bacterium]